MIVFKLVERSIGLMSTLILARLLTPADFGLLAMATVVIGFVELMGAFGFDVALIQRQSLQRVHYDTAWTFNVIFGAACALILLALAYPASLFYREVRLQWVLPALAISALANGFENIGTVAFRKELDFSREFRFLLAKKIAAFVVTMALAFWFRNYWALVGGTIAGKLFSVAISYRMHPYRPRLALGAHRDLLTFSQWMFATNLLLFLHNKSADFVLGRTVGARGLGIYSVAHEIAVLPATELIAPLNRAVFPAYSRLASNIVELRRTIAYIFGAVAILSFPVSAGLACVAGPAVRVLLGPQWEDAVPLLQLFTVAGLCSALQSNLFLVLLALGKPKVNTQIYAGLIIIQLPLLLAASIQYGTLGAAWVHLVMSIISLIPVHWIFFRVTGVRAREHMSSMWRPAMASSLMAAIVLWLQHQWLRTLSASPLAQLTICITAGAITYIVSLVALWWWAGKPRQSAERWLLEVILRRKLAPT